MVKAIKDELAKELPADEPDAKKKLGKYYEALRERIFREQVTARSGYVPTAAHSTRSGRSRSRPGVLPRTHGSALFTRGETQALVTADPRHHGR